MSQGKKFDEMMHGDLSLVENNARMFATITSEANQIVPLLTQKFMMRVKGSSDLSWSINKAENALILGKWVEVEVSWKTTERSYMLIFKDTKSNKLYQFTKTEFLKHVTQKGLAPRMFKAWKSTQEQ